VCVGACAVTPGNLAGARLEITAARQHRPTVTWQGGPACRDEAPRRLAGPPMLRRRRAQRCRRHGVLRFGKSPRSGIGSQFETGIPGGELQPLKHAAEAGKVLQQEDLEPRSLANQFLIRSGLGGFLPIHDVIALLGPPGPEGGLVALLAGNPEHDHERGVDEFQPLLPKRGVDDLEITVSHPVFQQDNLRVRKSVGSAEAGGARAQEAGN
jgi:hypothetical protein